MLLMVLLPHLAATFGCQNVSSQSEAWTGYSVVLGNLGSKHLYVLEFTKELQEKLPKIDGLVEINYKAEMGTRLPAGLLARLLSIKTLRTLILSGISFSPEELGLLSEQRTAIQTLDLSVSNVTNDVVQAALAGGAVTILTLVNCKGLSGEGVVALLKTSKTLKQVYVSAGLLSDVQAEEAKKLNPGILIQIDKNGYPQ